MVPVLNSQAASVASPISVSLINQCREETRLPRVNNLADSAKPLRFCPQLDLRAQHAESEATSRVETGE